MTEPFLDHIKSDALADGVNAEAVPQTFRTGVRPLPYCGRGDDALHLAPSRHAGPGPELLFEPGVALALRLADPMHHVEHVEQLGRNRDRAKNAAPAFFQALEDDHLAGKVDLLRRERQGFGYSAAAIMKDAAEGPDLARGACGGFEKRLSAPHR